MKHLEVRHKYSAARRIFNCLLSDETLRLMFDILLIFCPLLVGGALLGLETSARHLSKHKDVTEMKLPSSLIPAFTRADFLVKSLRPG